jgi:tetratricopeptide (TPR) repeat protein
MKSLAHDPRSRYVTAGQLRDDLQRFLTDRPISARPASLVGRGVRWSRREPTVAVLTFATFCLLFALATVSALGYFQTKSALEVAQSAKRAAENSLQQRTSALELADQQRRRAEKNLHVALTALDSIVNNITDRGMEPDAEFLGEVADTTSANVTPEDAELLQSLLGFFDELAANNSEDLLQESAVAARRAGEIYFRLGQLREADRALSDALDRYRRLKQQDADNLAFVIAQAEIMNELAVIASLRGYLGRANQLFDQTTEILENSEPGISSPAGQFEYARAHRLFSSLGARSGLDRSISRPGQRGSRPRGPLNRILQTRTDEELRAVDQAIDTLNALTEQSPEEVRFRAELARAYRDKAKVASRANRKGESEAALRASIEMFEKLLSENIDSEAIRYELAMTFSSSEALGFHQMLRSMRANELSTTLLSESPKQPRYQALRAHTLQTLAANQLRAGRLEAAETNLTQALRVYDALVSDSPELSLYETRRSQTLESIADVKWRRGDSEAAIDLLEQAIRRLQPQLRRPEASSVARIQLQRLRQKLSRIGGDS